MEPPAETPRLHPGIADIYRKQVARLEEALNDPLVRDQAGEALRALIDRVVLTPGTRRGEVKAELFGALDAILQLTDPKNKNRTSEEVQFSVVAGVGFGQDPTIEKHLLT